MAKEDNLKEVFEIAKKLNPFSVFQTEHGYLRLSEEQKELIREMTFAPGKHIFAYISGESEGIQCVEVSTEHPSAFDNFIATHEKMSLAYAYLGESDGEGKVSLQTEEDVK